MSRLEGELAASQAENAQLRGLLAQSRADNGHLRARLAIVNERVWSGQARGIQAFCELGRPKTDSLTSHPVYGGTGFCDGAWY